MKEDILEDIKRAISSATRAIAENKELEVVFEDSSSSSENKIISIGNTFNKGGDYNEEAINFINSLKGFKRPIDGHPGG